MIKEFFRQAKPIWLFGRESEWNCCMELDWTAPSELFTGDAPVILTLTGATFYQVFLDGELIHYGPARKAEGDTGVDCIRIDNNKLTGGGESECAVLQIRAIGYNCQCYSGVTNKSFVCAELTCGEQVLAATGVGGFKSYHVLDRVQRTARYCGQRHFSECWDLFRGKVEAPVAVHEHTLSCIDRYVAYPQFAVKTAAYQSSWLWQKKEELRYPLWSFLVENPGRDMYDREELETAPFEDYLRAHCVEKIACDAAKARQLHAGMLQKWDFGHIEAGFFRLRVHAEEDSRMILAFTEQLDKEGRTNVKALASLNLIEWKLPKGTYTLISQEPYTVRYAELMAAEGRVTVEGLEILELAYPADQIRPFETTDPELMEIYEAAVQTFRHNVLDIYMDCPSRERAGWLFDSYYTGKVEIELAGNTRVEDEFLNNYLKGGNCGHTPGMVEMCYPATISTGRFIPQWGMWYGLEVCEYLTERGHLDRKELFRQQLMEMIGFFAGYENEFGLLEKLPSWNFVEWSAVNDRVQDVSWATNMLYYGFLKQIGSVFDEPKLIERAEQLKTTIRKMAFDGQLFADRAMRTPDGIVNTEELSEVTQYYALKFDVIEIGEDACRFIRDMIYHRLKEEEKTLCKDMEPANALPGLYLRMDLLLRWEEYEMLLQEIKEYFLPMARETGTLWEHRLGNASRDHGFASFVGVAIKKATAEQSLSGATESV